MDLQSLSDKIEIRELLYRYSRGVDTPDWDLYASVFTADAMLDYTSVNGPCAQRDEVVNWISKSLADVPMLQHFITNIEIDLDGDEATVRGMFYNPIRPPGSDDLIYCGGNYHHRVVRTAEGWKSKHLREETKWFVSKVEGDFDIPDLDSSKG